MSVTLPTLFSIQGFMMWNFWSVYMSGELKSASNRRRQLWIMFGTLAFDTVLLFIVAPLSIAIFVALAVVSTQYPALVMQGTAPTSGGSRPGSPA